MARILVVEDNPDNLKLFRALLALNGHEVTGLPSGDGLQDAIRQSRPDLVLMDIQLPGKDGYALLEEIRAGPEPWCDLRIVALTAHARGDDERRANSAGFDGYITKPIEITAFPDQVGRALSLPEKRMPGGAA
ncbi:MAG TPA: response regulator [Gemmatimonadales bacterium]|nr:response regulator [Gemmatimonadales bacterium]